MNSDDHHIPRKALDPVELDTTDNYMPGGRADADGDGIDDEDERRFAPGLRPSAYVPDPPRPWWDRPLVRTLTGRNAAGKIVYTLAGGAVTAYTGVNLEPIISTLTGQPPDLTNSIMDMQLDLLDIVFFLVGALLTLITTRGLVKGLLNDAAIQVNEALDAVRRGREADSPGGKDYTAEEQALIWKEAEDVLALLWMRLARSRIARWLGLDEDSLNKGI